MKPLRLPLIEHDLLAVERYHDDTRHMIEFLVFTDCPMGSAGQHIRRFLTEAGYAAALEAQRQGHIQVRRHGNIIEGHILPDRPKKRRGK